MVHGPPHKREVDDRYSHRDPDTDEALDWFLRLQEAPDDPALRAEFEAWRRVSLTRREAFARLERMHAAPSLRKATERDAARLGFRNTGRVQERRRPTSRRWSMRVAAAAAVLLLAVGVHQYPVLMLRWQADYITATGERRTIRLPDGSDVILNTASAIAIDFEDGRRRIELLDGEAFFDVEPDAQRPFVVTGHFSAVEVKGTAFSVRADAAEDTVILERGEVEVSRLIARSERARLSPGKMIAATATSLSAVSDADPSRSLAWLEGRIIFQDQPFAKALDELSRYYSGRVVLVSIRGADIPVSGNYRIDDPEAAIRTLAAAAGIATIHVLGGILILH